MMVLVLDEKETPIREADSWESALAARPEDGSIGVGFVLRDEAGRAIAGACMSPEQALEQASYLFHVALRMAIHTNPGAVKRAADEMVSEATGGVRTLIKRHGVELNR